MTSIDVMHVHSLQSIQRKFYGNSMEIGMCVHFLPIFKGPNSENCLDLIFAAPPCEKVIIVPDTNYIISAIRKFMLDMPSPGRFQNIALLIWGQQGSEHVKPCGSNWGTI